MNVINVVAVFVFAQLLLVALLLLTLVPQPLLRLLPGSRSIQEILQLLSPGRLQKLVSRYLPEDFRRRAEELTGASRAHRVLFGRIEKWLVVFSSQLFAVAFNCGALLGCLTLIIFSDIAFSWNTTLQVDARQVHRLAGLLAAPWSSFVPGAVPTLPLVVASRYYRLGEGVLPSAGEGMPADAGLLGGWWPFLVLCMVCYGLLPRLALMAFSGWRLAAAVNHGILRLPGVKDLLERMNRELVETQAVGPESAAEQRISEEGARDAAGLHGTACAIVTWGESPFSDEELSLAASRTVGCIPRDLLAAGGSNTPAQDAKLIQKAVEAGGGKGTLIMVRAWEPPLDDFLDFLAELRSAMPGPAPIVVLPLGIGRGPAPIPPTGIQMKVWRTKLQGLGDPWLSVCLPEGEGF